MKAVTMIARILKALAHIILPRDEEVLATFEFDGPKSWSGGIIVNGDHCKSFDDDEAPFAFESTIINDDGKPETMYVIMKPYAKKR
jgi:hypothetical protein